MEVAEHYGVSLDEVNMMDSTMYLLSALKIPAMYMVAKGGVPLVGRGFWIWLFFGEGITF